MKTAFVMVKSDGIPFDGLAFAAYEGFLAEGYDVRFFKREDLILGCLNPTPETPLTGPMDAIKGAWIRMGVKPPAPLDYPDSLWGFLHRRVSRSTVGDLRRLSNNDSFGWEPLFVKPAQTHKLFDGFAWKQRADGQKISFVPDDCPVWVSECVEFATEYRIFVLNGEIIHVANYDGDPYAKIDRYTVEKAVYCYETSSEPPPVAYTMDFGLMSKTDKHGWKGCWETALVEVNDAFAFGPYTLANRDYARMIAARWSEITTPA